LSFVGLTVMASGTPASAATRQGLAGGEGGTWSCCQV